MQKTKILVIFFTLVVAFRLLPITVFAEDSADFSQQLFLSSRELVTLTFPAEPQSINAGGGINGDWWRLVQLATINENLDGTNFFAPTFGAPPLAVTTYNAPAVALTILEMVSSGVNPRTVEELNLVQELAAVVNADIGGIIDVGFEIWQMPPIFYALTASNAISDIEPHVIDALLALQGTDGGWDSMGFGTDVEATAQFILMLEPFTQRDGRVAVALDNAWELLLTFQTNCGGFGNPWAPTVMSVETTARVMEAIAALGKCPLDLTVDNDITRTPVHALINAMSPDGTFPGALSAQAHIGIATVGLRVNPFTNLRNPIAFPNALIPLDPNNSVDNGDNGGYTQTATLVVSDPDGDGVIFEYDFVLEFGETAFSLLGRTGLAIVYTIHPEWGVFVESIDGLNAVSAGLADTFSGWMFNVNGEWPGMSAELAQLSDGDIVVWEFLRDIPELATIIVSDPDGSGVIFEYEFVLEFGETAFTLLGRTGLAIVYTVHPEWGVFVESIDGLNAVSAGLAGTFSGWMFNVNGTFPGSSADTATLYAGDNVEWLFTRDPGQDVGGSGGVGGWSPPPPPANDDEENEVENEHEDRYYSEYENEYKDEREDEREDETAESEAIAEIPEGTPSFATENEQPSSVPNLREFLATTFTDVSSADWFYPHVRFMYERGLMTGVAQGVFAPHINFSRAMAVNILWRLEGRPVGQSGMSFDDIAHGNWYADSVLWARSNGIVQGFDDNTFRPTAHITREHFAVILLNFAEHKGIQIDTGILNYLVGNGTITRAEATAVFQMALES